MIKGDPPPNESPGFSPDAPTDNRKPGEWASRYTEPEAKGAIRSEYKILLCLILVMLLALVVVWSGLPARILGISPSDYADFSRFAVAAIGGALGGSILSLKWLYHTVAKHLWNRDRRLWRISTPLVGAVLALGICALVVSNLVRVFDPSVFNSQPAALGIGFVIGYTSDATAAKLIEIGEVLFGQTRSRSGD